MSICVVTVAVFFYLCGAIHTELCCIFLLDGDTISIMQPSKEKKVPKYLRAAHYIEELIGKGSLRPGDQVPSLRELASALGIGMNTVRDAYWNLERRGVLTTIPQSGHYVRSQGAGLRPVESEIPHPREINLCRIYDQHINKGKAGSSAALSIVQLDSALWPSWKSLVRSASQIPGVPEQRILDYAMAPGLPALQKAISRQLSAWGLATAPDSILITSGCNEAISLTLGELCKPGDVVAVESPLYFTFLNLLKDLDVRIIEIPNHPQTGLNLDILEFVLKQNKVRTVLCSPNFSNPLGSLMPDEHKQRLVDLASEFDTMVIEDDIYGDLPHLGPRPKPLKAFDQEDRVVYCSSFSKTISPGLRIGWVINTRLLEKLATRKTILNLACATPSQAMVAGFLESRSYERYLRRIRNKVRDNCLAMREVILREFPEQTAVSEPQGGLALWAQLPEHLNSEVLYMKAIEQNILIAPGVLFTIGTGFSSCIRFNLGIWNDEVEQVLIHLGGLARKML